MMYADHESQPIPEWVERERRLAESFERKIASGDLSHSDGAGPFPVSKLYLAHRPFPASKLYLMAEFNSVRRIIP